MPKTKSLSKNQTKQAVQRSLQNFQNRFNTQSGGTSATAFTGKAVAENKAAQRQIRRVQNPK